MTIQSNEFIIEQWLLLHSQQGDQQALGLLIERLNPLMIRHARRILGDESLIEDVVQEAWCSVVKGLNKVKDPAKIRAFVLKVVANKANDALRKLIRQRRYCTEPADATQQDESMIVEATESQHALLEPLKQALKRLPKDQALIIAMHYLDDLPLSDIADSLNIPIGTVKSRLFTARNRLKQHLETHHEHH